MKPESEAELAEMVAGLRTPVQIVGGGTRGVESDLPSLSTAGLSGISLYDPGALTLVARAGTPVAEIDSALAAEGQRLAFEPMDHRGLLGRSGEPTIGGVVAANISGPRRIQAGACRDFLLGARFVDGAGMVVSNGGRVMKNVTGYDLARLMAGACGTLGVLSEVSLKVLPVAEAEATLQIGNVAADQAVTALSRALGSPFDVTGAAWEGARALVRLEGFRDSVDYRAQRLSEMLAGFGTVSRTDGDESAAIWAGLRDVRAFQEKVGDVWRVSVKPTDAPDVIDAAGAEAVQMDWGGGLLWLLLPPGTDLRARLGALQGHATLVRASQADFARLGRVQPESAGVAALSAGLRAQFDPRGLFNPGVMN